MGAGAQRREQNPLHGLPKTKPRGAKQSWRPYCPSHVWVRVRRFRVRARVRTRVRGRGSGWGRGRARSRGRGRVRAEARV